MIPSAFHGGLRILRWRGRTRMLGGNTGMPNGAERRCGAANKAFRATV
jgi:hypothetical protein